MTPQGGTCTGAAWLSSARAVRCWVKSRNERNPCVQLPARKGGDSGQTAGVKPEEGGDDVKSSWPLCLGLHTYYNGPDKATQDREVEQIAKTVPQFRLYSAIQYMKLELLVIADQHCRGECVPEPCTHRPSSHQRGGHPKSSELKGRRRR